MPRKQNKSWGGRGGNNHRGGNDQDKPYFGHDDRGRNMGRDGGGPHVGPIKHRVSFKALNRPNNRDMSRNLALASLDEDIPMTGSNNNARQVIINQRDNRDRGDRNWRTVPRGRNSPMPNRHFKGGQPGPRMRPLPLGESNWYRIIIPYGHKYEKEFVINTLLNMVPQVIPIMYKIMGNEAVFYVDDQKIANALMNCDRKITMNDGFKLQVKVKPGFPACEIDDKLKDRLKQAMVKRYVQETNALNLSKFHLDPELYTDYFCINDVRRRFPKLLRLDGVELPRPIVFDVADESAKIPPSQRLFVADGKAQEIASQFLHQYFTIFDTENRQPLLDAYDEHASFSMTITTAHNNKLNGYIMESRNLFRINDTTRRQKLLKQGRLPVVSFVSEMPRTRHLLNTFTMDISLATQSMMFITITGYFQELDNKDEPIRYFNRTFIIVPEGEGYCIRNEQLHISQPPEALMKQLHQQLSQLNSQPTQPETPALGSAEVAKSVVPELSNDIKQQMTVTLSQQTNMNLEWSLKCLQETQWNYDNALSAFQEFYKRGQIPSEAFTK
ncbi:PREDICTED: nuclear RNA export factor 1-like [Wasmannia auropunctata]|uniref:nuclear RNA export factor 1-like n=1 Tax=Wasmannia auropunctata TaxID=64793 RepID=UPI0005EE5719|nr:PREDICTED: nuclear RNA export factor 1-like [Wasmannia auropunctata]